MANKHLIIGIGGTGGEVIAAYKRQIVEKNGKFKIPETEDIKFLYIDSSKIDINKKGSIWTYNGQDLSLTDEKIEINPENLSEKLNNIIQYPKLQNWIGNLDNWGFVATDVQANIGAGGQLRRLGRFNLSQSIDKILEDVKKKVDTLTLNKSDNDLCIHIVAGLAGGTGSGSIIDITAQISKKYELENKRIKVILYLQLPISDPPSDHLGNINGQCFYHANGYAALKELNGYAAQVFNPINISNQLLSNNNNIIKTSKPFHCAFIFSENNGEVKYSKEKVFNSIAGLIYFKTILLQNNISDKIKDTIERAENSENYKYDPKVNWGLFGNYLVAGIYKLAVPKQKIQNNFADWFVLNTMNKILFNKWDNIGQQGYIIPTVDGKVNKKEGEDRAQKILNDYFSNQKAALLQTWYLTPEYMTLDYKMSDNPFEIGSFDISTVKDDLDKTIKTKLTFLQGEKKYQGIPFEERELLKKLDALVVDYTTTKFRKNGYEEFYALRIQPDKLNQMATYIIGRIRNDLFGRDAANTFQYFPFASTSFLIRKLHTEYFDFLEKKFNEDIYRLKNDIANSEIELTNINNLFVKSFKFLGSKTKRENAIISFEQNLSRKWYAKIKLKGIEYSLSLLRKLQPELKILEQEVENSLNTFLKLQEEYQSEYIKKTDIIKNGIVDKDNGYISISDETGIAELRKKLTASQEEFDKIIGDIQTEVFKHYEDMISSRNRETIDKIVFEKVDVALEKYNDIIEDDIIDLLAKNRSNIKEYLEEIKKYSRPMVQDSLSNVSNLVILPNYKEKPETKEFFNNLVEDIGNSFGRDNMVQIGDRSEILFVQFASRLTTHVLKDCLRLPRDSYNFIKNNSNKNFFYLHIQDTSHLDDLYKPEESQFIDQVLPYIMLLDKSGYLSESDGKWFLKIYEDPEDKGDFLSPDKCPYSIIMCNTIESFLKLKTDGLKNIYDGVFINEIRERTKKELNRLNESDIEEILQNIKKDSEDILKNNKNDYTNPFYLKMKNGLEKLRIIISNNQ